MVQTIVTPAERSSSVTSRISPSATPASSQAASSNAPISPLPTPTLVETGTASPAAAQASGQASNKLSAALGEAAIIYRRSGGLAGLSEEWTIYPSGRIEASDGHTYRATAEQVDQALRDIEALGFFEMRDTYMSRSTCCDRFMYEITARRDSKVNRVTTIDAEPNAPPELWQVIDVLNRLVTTAGTS
jgi:hypothetical protein